MKLAAQTQCRRARIAILLLTATATVHAQTTLSGRVVDARSGAPLASAEVVIRNHSTQDTTAELETDADGRFGPVAAAAGTVQIEASKPGFLTTLVTLRPTEIANPVVVPLTRLGVIAGRIEDPAGAPQPNVSLRILIQRAGAWQPVPAPARTNSAGAYRFERLPPAQYAIASGGALLPDNASPRLLDLREGDLLENVNFQLPAPACYRLAGRADAGGAGARFQLSVTSTAMTALSVAEGLTGAAGSFDFPCIPPGDYDVLASGPMAGRAMDGALLASPAVFARTHVTVSGQAIEDVSLAMRPGLDVSFVLHGPASSECPHAATLHLDPAEAWNASIHPTLEIAIDTPRTLRQLPPARYALSVTGLGDSCYADAGPLLDLSAGAPSAPVPITVVAAGALHGKATAPVTLLPLDGPGQPFRLAFPGAAGTFAFEKLPPGRYRVAEGPSRNLDITVTPGPTELVWNNEAHDNAH